MSDGNRIWTHYFLPKLEKCWLFDPRFFHCSLFLHHLVTVWRGRDSVGTSVHQSALSTIWIRIGWQLVNLLMNIGEIVRRESNYSGALKNSIGKMRIFGCMFSYEACIADSNGVLCYKDFFSSHLLSTHLWHFSNEERKQTWGLSLHTLLTARQRREEALMERNCSRSLAINPLRCFHVCSHSVELDWISDNIEKQIGSLICLCRIWYMNKVHRKFMDLIWMPLQTSAFPWRKIISKCNRKNIV